MSIKLMSAAWEMDIPQSEKMVLLCLCDHANDAGECWPSVARLAGKCSVSDRTVQKSIQALKSRGILSWVDAPGRSHKFAIDPRRLFTPENPSPPKILHKPPKQLHPTPENPSPKPSVTVKEPSNKSAPVARPCEVSPQVWADFQSARRAQRAPVTETALARIQSEAKKAGWELEDALSEMVARGWKGFKAAWVENQSGNDPEYTGP